MNPKPPPPRDLGPMWLDLSHVIAGLPAPAAPRPAPDASPRRGPPRDDEPSAASDRDPRPAAGPALRWVLVAAMQLATAGATAALLMLLGLSPL